MLCDLPKGRTWSQAWPREAPMETLSMQRAQSEHAEHAEHAELAEHAGHVEHVYH